MPCPVILDDVLMAFDDARTGAALRALRDLSRKTQVLVYTHHAYQAEIAEEALEPSDDQLHDLAFEPLTAFAGPRLRALGEEVTLGTG